MRFLPHTNKNALHAARERNTDGKAARASDRPWTQRGVTPVRGKASRRTKRWSDWKIG